MADISGTTVIGIQGNSVSTTAPDDGHVLVWDAASSTWKPKQSLTTVTFTSSGTWTAPAGVHSVLVYAFGGGSGGVGSETNDVGGAGGNGAVMQSAVLSVTPNTQYTITIGAGGTGSSGTPNGTSPANSGVGGDTTFDSLFWTPGAVGTAYAATAQTFPGAGGYGGQLSTLPGANGLKNVVSVGGVYSGGTGGTAAAGYAGGGGGGAGPMGNGANGGSGNGTVGVQGGSNASANTGAGGGGAAVGGGANANGGNGGSGYLSITY